MKKGTSKARAVVCLLASHPSAVREMRRSLAADRFEVRAQTVSFDSAPAPRADVYVINVEGPFAMAARTISGLLREYPSAHLIAVADAFSEATVFPLLRKGVRGIIEYAALERQMTLAIDTIVAGGYWVPRIMLSNFVSSMVSNSSRTRFERAAMELSKRETEVMRALLDNLANKEIATRLGISERTVKFHVTNVLRKFGVRRRADLILLGLQKLSRFPST